MHRTACERPLVVPQPDAATLSPFVIYSVVHSPLYQVPTLYFSFHGLPDAYAPYDLDTVYSLLVANVEHLLLNEVGVAGSISMAVSTS